MDVDAPGICMVDDDVLIAAFRSFPGFHTTTCSMHVIYIVMYIRFFPCETCSLCHVAELDPELFSPSHAECMRVIKQC